MPTDIHKTLDQSSAGGTLVDEDIDEVIQDLAERNNPIRANLPRREGQGQSWIVVRRTAEPSGQWVNDTEEPGSQNSTYARKSFTYKTPFVRGKVSRKLVRTGMSYTDVEAQEIETCLRVIQDTEEYGTIYGNNTSNTKQFDGLEQLTPSSQVVDMSNSALTLRKLDEAFDKCYGLPGMMFVSKRSRRDINQLLQSQQRFVDTVEVKGGFTLTAYMDTPIYWSAQMSNDETGNSDTSVYLVDPEYTFMGVLTELTMERLPTESSQYSKFDVYEDVALVARNEYYNARVKRITEGS